MNEFLRTAMLYNIRPLFAPDDGTGTGELDTSMEDGTVAGAALAIKDLDLGDDDDEGDGGTQAAADDDQGTDDEGATDDDEAGAAADDTGTKASADDDKSDASNDDDDSEQDWFELPPEEEGGEPTRVAADDVWAGYQKSEELAEENAKLKERNGQIPEEVDQALKQTIDTRQQLVASLQQWQDLQVPPEPDPNMLDVNHESFDVAAYKEAKDRRDAFIAAQSEAQKELAKQQEAMQEENAIRIKAVRDRSDAEIKQFWPELIADKDVRASFDKQMQEEFGATPEEMAAAIDPRFFRMAKLALEQIQSQKATKKAVKIVRGKAKLVKGKARDPNTKRTERDRHMAALHKDGDSEANALKVFGTFEDT